VSPRRTDLSETELEILKALWEAGSATVRGLHDQLAAQGRQWAYTTVLTFLTRLEAKGYVASEKSGVAHVFRSVVSREKLLRQKLVNLAAELCDGTASPLVRALVEGQRFSPDEISQFRRLLDDLEAPPAKATKRKKTEDRGSKVEDRE
jgi:BlaI family transcriptional regulator, penicillinase repressor